MPYVLPDEVPAVYGQAYIPIVDPLGDSPLVSGIGAISRRAASQGPVPLVTPHALVTPFAQMAGSKKSAGALSAPALAPSTTGMNRFWSYESGEIPGAGRYFLNVANGNLVVQHTDVDVAEPGIDLAFARSYNTQSQHDYDNSDGSVPSNYGMKWTATVDAHLGIDASGAIMSVYDIDGARYDYTFDGTNWDAPPGMQGTIFKVVPGSPCLYDWVKKSGTVYQFYGPTYGGASCGGTLLQQGRLREIFARNQRLHLRFTYYADGHGTGPDNLSKIVVAHTNGDTLTLVFAHFGTSPVRTLLSTITLPDNKTQVVYQYNALGQLQEVDLPAHGGTQSMLPITYGYTSPLMDAAMGPRYTISQNANGGTATDGSAVLFEYDSSSRIAHILDKGVINPNLDAQPSPVPAPPSGTGGVVQPNSGVPSTQVVWHQNDFGGYDSGTTTYSDSDGHAATWAFNSAGNVTQTTVYPGPGTSGALTSSAGWSANELQYTVDARSFRTDYQYDANGNTTAVLAPQITTSQGLLRPTSRYGYDANNNLVAYCDPNTVAANGLSTCTASTPSAVQFTYSMTDAQEPFGCLQSFSTPPTSQNPSPYVRTYSYDSGCGTWAAPTSVTGQSYTQIDASRRTPSQTFAYDTKGRLKSYDLGSGVTTFTYDALNRPVQVTDPDSVSSYKQYYPDGMLSLSESAYQHAHGWGSSFMYDADGDLVRQSLHRGGSYAPGNTDPSPPPAATADTLKYYDGADRLVEVVQPYNAHGDHEAYTNPWATRYLYDLSQSNGAASQTFGTSAAFSAYGNLFATKELLPASGTQTYDAVAGTRLANATWIETKGNAYDGLDRAVQRFYYTRIGQSQSQTLESEKYGYDTASGSSCVGSYAGLQTWTKDALGHDICLQYNDASMLVKRLYIGASQENRTFTVDPDGQLTSVADDGTLGTRTFTYDEVGRLIGTTEPQKLPGAATLTYLYYPDGLEKSLGVTSPELTQDQTGGAPLFAYAYEPNGQVKEQRVEYDADTSVGKTALTYQYSAAGRLQERDESGPGANPTATTYTHSPYGFLTGVNFPGGNESAMQYDPTGLLLGYQSTPNGTTANTHTFAYSVRGEAQSENVSPPGVYQNTDSEKALANGVAGETVHTNTFSWDPLMGATTGSTSSTPGKTGTTTTTTAISYDELGRETTDASDSKGFDSGGVPAESGNTITRDFDRENHVVDTNQTVSDLDGGSLQGTSSYVWGLNGHPAQISQPAADGSGTKTETLHWSGDTLLFTTRATSGNPVAVDDIKLGSLADVTPLDPSFTGITFWDRDPSSTVVYCHNNSGAAGIGYTPTLLPKPYPREKVGTHTLPAPCGITGSQRMTVPSSIMWWSDLDNTLRVGTNSVVGMLRGDGFEDGFNQIQGVRAVDQQTGAWTTPDAFQGEVDDPITQKSYAWNGNNPVGYSDPSGYSLSLYTPVSYITGGGLFDDQMQDMTDDATGAGQAGHFSDADHKFQTAMLDNAVAIASTLMAAVHDDPILRSIMSREHLTYLSLLVTALNQCFGSAMTLRMISASEAAGTNSLGFSLRLEGNENSLKVSATIGTYRQNYPNIMLSWDRKLDSVLVSINNRGHYSTPYLYAGPGANCLPWGRDFDIERFLRAFEK